MNFSSSQLVRLLGTWTPVDAKASRQDFAEQMAQWLNVADAMALHSTHQSMASRAGVPTMLAPAAQREQATAWVAEVQRVRADLLVGFQGLTSGASGASSTRTARTSATQARLSRTVVSTRPAPASAANMLAGDEIAATFAHHHQRYLDQQRRMALRVDALRVQLRQALTQASGPLAQLAMLDAVMDRALGAREQKLLAGVPQFLEKRFEQLRLQHLPESRTPTASEPDSAVPAQAKPPPTSTPAIWLRLFAQDMEATLRAELDVRLQPVLGLLDALTAHCNALRGQPASSSSPQNAFKTPLQA